jgi:glycosyltransferase involved in cell wall biosynthesis
VKVSVLTPTADRPVAFALLEQWMARQTRQPDEWIVADGGLTSATCTLGQQRSWVSAAPGSANFAANLLRGLSLATGDVIVFCEDDDYYAPTHLATIVTQLIDAPAALAAGDDRQRYYNVAHRCWRRFQNTGASLCQSAIRRAAVPRLVETIHACQAKRSYGVDTTFWRALAPAQWALHPTDTVVGTKGLPGQTGLGIGHRPDALWTADRDLQRLRAWMGDDAAVYADFHRPPMGRLTGRAKQQMTRRA